MSLKLAVDNGEKEIGNMSQEELVEAQKIAVSMSFEQRSDFYNKLLHKAVPSYIDPAREPSWLKNDFKEPVWKCKFGKIEKIIDFNVKLNDGELLTSGKHRETLDAMKYWLCTLNHPRYCGGRSLATSLAKRKIIQGLHILDMLLIRAKHFNIAEHGLSLINRNDALSLLTTIQSGVVDGIYDFSNQVSSFLATQIQTVSEFDIADAREKYPTIVDVPRVQSLPLSYEQIVKARVWLLNQGAYCKLHSSPVDRGVSNILFRKNILRNTLQGMSIIIPTYPELRIMPSEVGTEYRRVPTSTKEGEGMVEQQYRLYLGLFRSLALIEGGVPVESVAELDWKGVKELLSVVKVGRHRTLPANVVFESLKNAFEFFYKYAGDILDSVAQFLEYQPKITSTRSQRYIDRNNAAKRVTSPKLQELGVKGWRISDEKDARLVPEDYFQRLRANEGLGELYEVLLGSVQIIIGAMMARRVNELYGLKHDCLVPNKNPYLAENENTSFSLVFENSKSGEGEEREELARPIILSGAKLVWTLQQFRERLVNSGAVKVSDGLLFQVDKRLATVMTIDTKAQYYRSLDTFSDYFQTKVVRMSDGEVYRYYIRQHQLRRFFAMAFFWGSGFAGLDTLRYFLGHTDAEHLYHYITELTPGLVLRSVKAETLVHGINRDEIENIESLREILKNRFGVRDIQIQSLEEVAELLEDEIDDGVIKTEPPLSEIRTEIEKDIFELITDGTIDLQPTFANVVNDEGETVQKIHLVLKVEEIKDGD
ncbi:hypothetical protein [Parashewanella tropica]|uniref:hypothetical protein n=1 Tax=Parashewanella tropica TaxID=2547970 RepID=UPI00105A2EBF|nr:hypothetical protein [Parashewanella tropica]